ncbi:MAG: DUF4342 domain-containing protein [Erysipelotrichaceae bacterium]|nr:DUF4342 domain-containing protein [Erysipelotrichaceae bacterium]
MNFSIHEVDQVIERTQCTYEEAKSALLESDGDVLDAIIILENKKKSGSFKSFADFFNTNNEERTPDTIVEKIKDILSEGNATKFLVRDQHGLQVAAVPLPTGAAIGTLALLTGAAPLVVIASLIAKFGLNYQFVIVKSDGSEIVL